MEGENKMEKRMSFDELEQTLKSLDNAGKEATLRHNDKFSNLKDEEEIDGLKNHLPGSMPGRCDICDEIIYSFDKFMKLEQKYLGVSGVPLAEVITNIRMIRNIMKMVEEEKNGFNN